MRVFVPVVLFLCVLASTAQGERGRIANFHLLRDAIARVFAMPAIAKSMTWQRGGLLIDDLNALLRVFEPQAHQVLLNSSKYRRVRHLFLGLAVYHEMGGEVFSMPTPSVQKRRYWRDWYLDYATQTYFRGKGKLDHATKYFWGKEEPDIRHLIAEVMFAPEMLAKMEWEIGGLSVDAIIADFKEKHPDVYTLYTQSYYHKTDAWLREFVQGRMHEDSSDHDKLGDYFTQRVTVDGKTTYKFLRGKAKPDLERSIVMAISNAALINQMVDRGVTMDDIVAALKEHSRVYNLYVQAANGSERGLRVALGKAMSRVEEIVSRKDDEGTKRYFWE